MTPMQIWLAVFAFLLWTASVAWFFRREIRHWWKTRTPRREQARKERAEREAELTRMRDELAEKYLPPASGSHPGS